MICLSKADEGTFRHLEYNQSPRSLAAEHTTRQDLNGIANLREHVAAGQDGDGGCNSDGGGADTDEKRRHGGQPPGGPETESTGRWLVMPSPCRRQAACSFRLSGREAVLPLPSFAAVWGWGSWLASVLAVSLLVNYVASPRPSTAAPVLHHKDELVSSPRQLARRGSTCDTSGVSSSEYNTGLHAGALIIIWFVSTLACGFPMLARRLPGLRIPQRFFFVVRHFGTGVLIATAFVHLLPTAFISLGDPCLGDFWVKDYPAIPGAIALAAIFFVTVIEMVFHPARRCTSVPADVLTGEKAPTGQAGGVLQVSENNAAAAPSDNATLAVPMRDMQPPRRRSGSMVHGLNRLNVIEASDDENEAPRRAAGLGSKAANNDSAVAEEDDDDDLELATTDSPASGNGVVSPEQKLRKERLQCVLLELGILFHSVFIGMALSVSVGNEFVILLIAIVFHR
jgi:solute carrier family 39 (zinc transporter), member 1/2/3